MSDPTRENANNSPDAETTQCAVCGCALHPGTARVFTVCDNCWDKHYAAMAKRKRCTHGVFGIEVIDCARCRDDVFTEVTPSTSQKTDPPAASDSADVPPIVDGSSTRWGDGILRWSSDGARLGSLIVNLQDWNEKELRGETWTKPSEASLLADACEAIVSLKEEVERLRDEAARTARLLHCLREGCLGCEVCS